MILGDFEFSLKNMSPQSLTRTTEYNWTDAETVGNLPNFQNLGISKDEIEISGVFYPKFNQGSVWNYISPSITDRLGVAEGIVNQIANNLLNNNQYFSVEDIRNSNLCKVANNLINDDGSILGRFVISSIKETQSYFDKNGRAQKIEFSLTLKRTPSTTASAINSNGSNIVESLTNLARSYLKW